MSKWMDIDKWQEIVHSLKSNKGRTILTGMGVFWGIFILIILFGVGAGFKNAVTYGFKDVATNSMFIFGGQTGKAYQGFKRGRQVSFTLEDKTCLEKQLPDIKFITPRINSYGTVVRGLRTGEFMMNGDFPEINLVTPYQILQGRFLNKVDINEKRKVAVIGKQVAEKLFKPGENPIGQYIRAKGVYFQVIGVCKPKTQGGFGPDGELTILLPFSTMQQAFNMGNFVGYFTMVVKDNIPVAGVEEKALAILRERHHVHPEDEHAIGHFNLGKIIDQVYGLFTGINILIWVVGLGTLFAGAVGVSNIMLIVVKERTKEIGIKRTMGATPKMIITQIMSEAIVLTSIAGYLGLLLAVGIIELIGALGSFPEEAFRDPHVHINHALLAIVFITLTGTLAGIIPARKAIRIKPVDALRT